MRNIIKCLMVILALFLFTNTALADNEVVADPDEPDPAPTTVFRDLDLCTLRLMVENVDSSERWKCREGDIIWYLSEARIPEYMRADFLTVAACESGFNRVALGDGGWSKGLLQIRWDFWADWANVTGYAYEVGLTDTQEEAYTFFDVNHEDWDNPIKNFQLGLIINQMYDMKRYGTYWEQWTGHPNIPGCTAKRDRLLSNLYQHAVTD